MPRPPQKHIEQLREELVENLRIDFFDEDEIKNILDAIDVIHPLLRQKTLALCVTLSHASSTFVGSTLNRIKKAGRVLSSRDMEKWLGQAFDLLDAKGIDPFIRFISTADSEDSLRRFQVPAGLRLHSVQPQLETYIQGISGMGLKVAQGKMPYTDGATIFLPSSVNLYSRPEMNLLVYKLMLVHQWARIVCQSLFPDENIIRKYIRRPNNHPDINSLFRDFSERELALDLYNIFESFRTADFLEEELPALMRDAGGVKEKIFEQRPQLSSVSPRTAVVEGLYQLYLKGTAKGKMPDELRGIISGLKFPRNSAGPFDSYDRMLEFYKIAQTAEGPFVPSELLFIGIIRPEKISGLLKAKRAEKKKKYEGIINRMLTMPEFEPRVISLSAKPEKEPRELKRDEEYLLMKGKIIELDSELREIIDERGGTPGGILVKGSDLGAGTPITLSDLTEEEEVSEMQAGGILYDEWDYRRGGYRKDWCSLYEHDIHPGHEPFVEMTLIRYGAYVRLLRNKFEMLKREPRILRRQRDGDDIDIDATVEAFSDMHAGLSPAEDLFVRLDRQERNIAVLFLLDMSGSTKGWVNEAEKESLVLMCEALQALGDRYSIYGFSGMTRTKCDYYRIKGFDEEYSEAVKKRISGIEPKDYTRMGAPIRHSNVILRAVEARTKLLVILSDGKPEDWDAYKGEFAIEDTRRALIESKEKGIHPFCITIDKEARSYLPHMYGEANYILRDDVRKLPDRITEIYRRITT